MAIPAITTIPLILLIVGITSRVNNTTKNAAYADGLNANGKLFN